MPIYAYRCAACGHAKDVLQKMSDPVLSTCPACGQEAFAKQLTAAGFQLKGSGWYATDFKHNGAAAKPTPAAGEGGAEAAAAASPVPPAQPEAGAGGDAGVDTSAKKGDGKSAEKSVGKAADKGAAAPAAAPSPAAATAPSGDASRS